MISFLVVIEEEVRGRVRLRVSTPNSNSSLLEVRVAREFQEATVRFEGNGFRQTVVKPWSGANNNPARQ